MFRRFVLPFLVFWLYRLWTGSWKKVIHEPPELLDALKNKAPLIFAHWHGHELAIVHLVHRYKLATMTSTSKDGQLIDSVIQRLGGKTSKGSSTRGAVSALKGLVRLVKSGHPASMAVDGPKGPIYVPKPGVFELSRLTGAIIFPVGVAASHPITFERSWNKAILPKPFTKVGVFFGDPLPAIQRNEDPKSQELSDRMKTAIAVASQQASKLIDRN